jgi:O-methyltransferase involved in polyketide biosynthesis
LLLVRAHERIAPTAHYTAHVWRRLGLAHAELFATPTGAALYWLFRATAEWMTVLSPRVPSMVQFLGYRHLLIDSELGRIAPDCVVELGAGLSRRGVTWAVDRNARYVEIDLPAMIAAKRRLLARASTAVRTAAGLRLELVAADVLAPDFADVLSAALERSSRPVVITEGLVSYFAMDARERLFEVVAAALARRGGGSVLCDLHTKERQHRVATATRVLKLALRTATGGQGAKAPFDDLAHVSRFFCGVGFDSVARLDAHDHVDEEPRLAKLFSPALVIHARVARPPAAGAVVPYAGPR